MFFGDSKNTSQGKGHNKVVAMTNFRNTVPVSSMRQAEAYWTALRRGDDIPSRAQISMDPLSTFQCFSLLARSLRSSPLPIWAE